MRPTLRPGLQILRRDLRTYQLGHEWPGLAALVDTPAVRALLAAVDGYRDRTAVIRAATDQLYGDGSAPSTSKAAPQSPPLADGVLPGPGVGGQSRIRVQEQVRSTFDRLVRAGVFVDQADTRRPQGVDEATWASLWLQAGPGRSAHELQKALHARKIAVLGNGKVADGVIAVLSAAGRRLAKAAEDADALVIAADEPPERRMADQAMRTGLPHLWAYVCDLVGFVGPFVAPGDSACLRCVDFARTDRDRAWPTLVQSASRRRLAVAACDSTLAAVVAALAAQQVSLWAAGSRPHTLEAVLEVPHGSGAVESSPYHPHPFCGCGWSTRHDTMGA